MTTNKQASNSQKVKDLDNQIVDLVDEAKKVNHDIDASSKESSGAMDDLDAKVNASVSNVEQIYSDLDKIEKETSDELDKLILEEAVDLAKSE